MSDPQNVKLGICKVYFNDVDLGYTKGGVEIEVSTQTHEVKVDQFGETAIADVVIGRMVSAKVPLAETTLANLVKIMPGASLVTDAIDSSKKRVNVPTGIGADLRTLAQELRLHPQSLADNNLSDDFVIPLAAPNGSFNFAYKVDDERVFNVTFKGYPNISTNDLYYVGDGSFELAVPANVFLPSISGVAQVGVVLTAVVGTWSNSPTSYAYQWKANGSNIVGATSATYTPVEGDVGVAISVQITATNSAGAGTPAVSGGTAAVLDD